jgi:molybdenum cofactor cytidylyltransferase
MTTAAKHAIPKPTLVVLAAGRGSRFGAGRHKLLQPLGTSNVLATTLGHALETELPLVVVATEALAGVAQQSVASRDIVVLPEVGAGREPLGMGYSIATGVAVCPGAAGWLILPGDMPAVRPSTMLAVAHQLAQHAIAYAQHRGRRGHPVGFAAELYSELVALEGDEGARRLLARYPAHGVEVDDAGVLVDIDTPADLDRLRNDAAAGTPGGH